MTDKDTPTPRTDENYRFHQGSPLEANHAWGYCRQLERETVELRQSALVSIAEQNSRDECISALEEQLAALEQKRKEDIRKIEDMAARHYIPGHSVAGPQFSDVLAQGIRAAFPDVFKEKDNES